MAVLFIFFQQLFKVRFLFIKFIYDFLYKSILIVLDIHHVEVITHDFLYSLHLRSRNNLSLGNGCLADFTLFTEHIWKFWIVRLYGCSTVLDSNLLLIDKHCSHISNINLSPTIRYSLISALNICHRGWKISSMLRF